jgi:ABC-2 type transport system ATP-binding protein
VNGIEIEELVYRYRSRVALDKISFQVPCGKIVGLLGANGAGKSTLLRVLCGLLRPAGGKVTVAGRQFPKGLAKALARTGYVAQQFGLYEDLTVQENIRFYARAYGLDDQAASVCLEQTMLRFDLAHRRNDRAGELSHGWRQRLALASALTHVPQVLLLDEATAGLDPAARRQVWRVIEEERSRGAAVLTSTHHLDEAAACDFVIWLDAGKVAGQGRYAELAGSLDCYFEQRTDPA